MNPVEIELLVACTRTWMDAHSQKSVQKLCSDNIDWEKVIQASLTHRVMPLLFINLQKGGCLCAHSSIMSNLQTLYYTNLQHSLSISGELSQLAMLFKDYNIDFIPVKGPALAKSVYGDVALRQYADLDILLDKKDVLPIYQLLTSSDYHPEVGLNSGQMAAYIKTEYSLSLYHAETKVTVELHWNLTGRYTTYPFDMNGLDGHWEWFAFEGISLPQLSKEDLMIYLCIHGSKDGWCTLDSVCCVAELVQSHKGIDWPCVIDRAEQMRCRRMLFVGLLLAHDILSAPIEGDVLKVIETDPVAIGIASNIRRSLFKPPLTQNERQIPSNFSFCHFKIRESFSDRVRYLLNLLFVPSRRDWGVFKLPASMAFLHYPLRPLRLAGELVLTLFRNRMSESPAPEIRQAS